MAARAGTGSRLGGVVILALGCGLCGCQAHRADSFTVRCTVQPNPPHIGQATAHVTIVDGSGHSATLSKVTVEANMTHPGMQPVLATARQDADGGFNAQLSFEMAGDWTLTVEAQPAQGAMIEREFPLSVTDRQ